ncbi:MAG: heterocyst development glycosyltransferase HepC [Pseudanabaena sp. ELA607]|jgi:lipopolysaccharide/colanic/teichoic acid biosynthesis glycosyltransferase
MNIFIPRQNFTKPQQHIYAYSSHTHKFAEKHSDHHQEIDSTSINLILDRVELFLYHNFLYVLPQGSADFVNHRLYGYAKEKSNKNQIECQERDFLLTHLPENTAIFDNNYFDDNSAINSCVIDLSIKPVLEGICLAESLRFLRKSDEMYLFNWLANLDFSGIYIAPNLSESQLTQWAKVSSAINKPLHLLLPLAEELPHHNYPMQWLLKRLGDWWAALLILVILSPLLLLTTALVKFTSAGPVLFSQWRVGKQGKLFKILKFRTMIIDAEALHHKVMAGQNGLHKCQRDPRVTWVGSFLRKYSIDELPQLLNVLRGEMSLVGPRPWALYDALRIEGVDQRRLNALPGITGAWQVSKRSTLLDLNAVTKYDLQYLCDWSLVTDLQILLMTVPKVLSGFGAF